MSGRRRRQRSTLIVIAALYLVALALSPVMRKPVRAVDDRPAESRDGVVVPAYDAAGPIDIGRPVVISALDLRASNERGEPIVFLHGSPGGLDNVAGLEPFLTEAGRRTVTLDLPGFGNSDADLPDIGARAHARYVLALMDELGIDRAHVVGWSNGGAVALNMADIAPDRVGTVTLLASVGVQETEGSGSYLFEHAKYKAGRVLFRGLQLLTPHFGVFGWSPRDFDWLRNFDQTDQRELRPIMASLKTPTLVLHGRHDFLTPAWGARLHHQIIPTSRLVILDGSHFLPMPEPIGQARESAEVMEAFMSRHDTPGVVPITTYEDRAPNPERAGVARAIEWVGERLRWTPWWAVGAGLALLSRRRPELATVLAGMYVGRVDLDIGVAILGLFVGRLTRQTTPFDGRRFPLGWLGTLVWTCVAVGVVFLLEQNTFWNLGPDDAALRFGTIGFVAYVVVLATVLHIVRNLPRRRGRQRLRAQWTRLTSHEFWPAWALYAPCVPIWLGRFFKRGGVLAFTAANPGIPHGGGIVGESKSQILRAMGDDPRVLPHVLVPPTGTVDERAARATDAINREPGFDGFPVIMKPDVGERGADVKMVGTKEQVRSYLIEVETEVIVQRFAPGPAEFGVLWARDPACVAGEPEPGGLAGRVLGITEKRFPAVVGDGERTLFELVLADRRLRAQARTFFARFSGRDPGVVEAGKRVSLGNAGNHVQGCGFFDGGRLCTPELERAIDDIARSFEGGLDFGRFDVRCPSAAHLARGEGLEIIELNGVTGEATNHYDPDRSAWYAWGVLRGQWRALYAVADARIAAGATPLSWRAFLRVLRTQRRATGVTD